MKKTRKTAGKGLPVTTEALDARPDSLDFRDNLYVPTLVEVPIRITLDTYRSSFPRQKAPILNQGQEGACTGFGLAAVAHFLLRRRKVDPDPTPVSPRMFYEMARRYDEWPGESYSGSSARGAMKGWHKHGVCASDLWLYDARAAGGGLNHQRAVDAARRPLGAYFRVNHRDLAAMHSALAEVGILYATAMVHEGWGQVNSRTGIIPGAEGKKVLGGHAFALVGYDERGFWLQNSWGPQWGYQGGFALLTYADWIANGTDVWVARLGAPVILPQSRDKASFASLTRTEYSFTELRPHIISLGNDGRLRNRGTFGSSPAGVRAIFAEDFPRLTRSWPKKRLLLYAHGGLVDEESAILRVADYRQHMLDAQVYPLAFVWKTDLWTTLGNLLQDVLAKRRPEGFLGAAKDFLLDRLDDTLEPLVRPLGKPIWGEMKENALLATASPEGGVRFVLRELAELIRTEANLEIHIAGHSAGSIFMAPVVQAIVSVGLIQSGPARGMTGLNTPLRTCALWAPACTMRLFQETYLPAIRQRQMGQFTLFTLKDRAEQDDHCARIYSKSLLYLVAHALEEKARIFLGDGEPILGLEKFLLRNPDLELDAAKIKAEDPSSVSLCGLSSATWVRSPNGLPEGNPAAAQAAHHGDFDDDQATVKATLARIAAAAENQAPFGFASSPAFRRDQRKNLLNRMQAQQTY